MLHVALAGNPNTGKTTLFNVLTGSHAHVGNYPGITVDRRTGEHRDGAHHWLVHDLPGCYSLVAHSPEEEIAHHVLTGRYGDRAPDVVVVVLDAANLARNLLLLLQIAELDLPVVGALNMMDAADAQGLHIDVPGLAQALGCPLVPMVARTAQGIEALQTAVAQVASDPTRGRIATTDWPQLIVDAVATGRALMARPEHAPLAGRGAAGKGPPPDGEVLWWLSCDPELADRLRPGLGSALARALPRAEDESRDVRRLATSCRYARIDALIAGHTRRDAQAGRVDWTDRIDALALHPVLGVGLFLLAMGVLFQAVFAWSDPFITAIDEGFSGIGEWVRAALPAGLLTDVLVDGVLAGVAGTLVFLPQIAILFLGIALLEDTGYLARTAFLLDRLMTRAGLPGKSFVPLLSSFACNVPGILAARTIPSRGDRMITILIAPLMTCAARLPVYTMVTAAVFAGAAPVLGILSVGGLFITGMYLFGVVLALVVAWVLRRTVVGGTSAPLLLEMPPYRVPRVGTVAREVALRVRRFVVNTGSVIVALTVVLWALMTFPRGGMDPAERDRQVAAARAQAGEDEGALAAGLAQIAHEDERLQLRDSIAGRIGRAIEPAIAPMGFDWRIGIGLVGSLAAREVLIPVMGRVYGRGAQMDDEQAYAAGVGRSMVRFSGMTPLVGISLMVFFAVAMQCLSTLAAIRDETQGWRWPLFALVYLNGLAWLLSTAVFQIGGWLGLA